MKKAVKYANFRMIIVKIYGKDSQELSTKFSINNYKTLETSVKMSVNLSREINKN